MNIYHERISSLRAIMAENGWDAVLVSSSDPHSSEYPAPRWKQVEWISGFTGEAGDVVVTMDEAGLWTDSRYFIQAVRQLEGTGVDLHKTRVSGTVGIPQWLADKKVGTVVIDGECLSVDAANEIRAAVDGIGGKVADVPGFLGRLWTDRPGLPVSPVTTVDSDTVGESRFQKIAWLRKHLMVNEVDSILLSAPDEVAWMLNVRGSDIEYNPYVLSYLYVSLDRVCWFMKKDDTSLTDPDTEDSIAELASDEIEVLGYDEVYSVLAGESSGSIMVDPATLNAHLYEYVEDTFGEGGLVRAPSPVPLRKSVKNEVEIRGLREAYHADGLAVERFLHWLEVQLASGKKVTEREAADRLGAFRAEIPGYRGDSFACISAYGPNAALPHYSTPEENSAVIEPHGLYLVDSGGQYLFGTTDITRTVPVGECTALEGEDYTLVLRGMIDLSMAVFPEGTPGTRIDAIARCPLWSGRRDYGHGTGHGIGFYLGVHEGPQTIRQSANQQPMLPGMVTSNEPGLYREGLHGIRHENVVLCVEDSENEFGRWLRFETLTCCHIETSAIIKEMMTADEISWLNAYNQSVYEALSPELDVEEAEWLRKKTLPL
ncbi:MAG: aminopeptidase P family protein [Candidatus Cryptobacteroides sp.]